MTIAFVTPGLIDLRAFTIMGCNAKPNSTNPIGYFGTGLKYAIAVGMRLDASVTLYRGEEVYEFGREITTFRGKDLEQIWMRRRPMPGMYGPDPITLPFTTDYGKNWQPWMVYRELESNTRDENGKTCILENGILSEEIGNTWNLTDRTIIRIDHPEIEAAHTEAQVFCTAPEVARGTTVVIRERGEGTKAYYRGVRARELDKPALYTYDFLNNQSLTEDRTFATEYYVRDDLARYISSECEDGQIIRDIVTASEATWENGLEYSVYNTPSDLFNRIVSEKPAGLTPNAFRYWGLFQPPAPKCPGKSWSELKRPWTAEGDYVFDADGNSIFEKSSGYEGDWSKLGEQLAAIGNAVTKVPEDSLNVLLKINANDGDDILF